jgi:hypothetical protein
MLVGGDLASTSRRYAMTDKSACAKAWIVGPVRADLLDRIVSHARKTNAIVLTLNGESSRVSRGDVE